MNTELFLAIVLAKNVHQVFMTYSGQGQGHTGFPCLFSFYSPARAIAME